MSNQLNLKLVSELPSRISRGELAKQVFEGFDGEYDFALPETAIPYLCNKHGVSRDTLVCQCVMAYTRQGEYPYGVVVNMITGRIYV